MSDHKNTIKVCAVQMCAEVGEVQANLERAERLVRHAFEKGAQWVILPEFFTSAVGFHPKLLDAARPSDGAPYRMLVGLSREYDGVVGGSFISLRSGDAYNTFVLALPDGSTFTHDKDLPTMWENCYYVGGNDDGVLNTPVGTVGVALCWEFVRTRTVRRLMDRVDLVVGGSCWWGPPDTFEGEEADKLRAGVRNTLKQTPSKFAEFLGVPVVHASHAGELHGFNPFDEQIPYDSRFYGESQIVDGRGNILARRSLEEGEGIILAEITTGPAAQARPTIPETFWIPEHPESVLRAWEKQNAFGKDYYRKVTLPHRCRADPPGSDHMQLSTDQ